MSFSLDLKRFADKADVNMATAVRKTVMEIGARLVEKTPVGDATLWKSPPPKGYVGGRAKANWQYGFNSAPPGDLPDIDPSGAVSIQSISGVFEQPVAGIHYLTNNLPYAQRLEDGWSTQAPYGMVGLTLIEAPQIVEEAAREANK